MTKHHKTTGPRLRAGLYASVVILAGFCARVSAQPAPAGPFSQDCSRERAGAKADLGDLFRSQASDGSIPFHGASEFLGYHPLLATFCAEMYRNDNDKAFLGEAHAIITKQMGYYLSTYDADGDFLLERPSSVASPSATGLEDVGFNAMFALDMLNMSRICLDLGMPVDALYWYQGTKTVARRIIEETYDTDAGYFLPMDNARGARVSQFYALSSLASCFSYELGDNIAASILRNYVLTAQPVQPEVPYEYLDWARANNEGDLTPAKLMKTLLLLAALEWNGLGDEASQYSSVITRNIDEELARMGAASDVDPYTGYLACLIGSNGVRTLLPRYHEIDLFEGVTSLYAVLPGEARSRLVTDLGVIRALLEDPASAPDVSTCEQAVRNVYRTVSSLKDKWRSRSLFTPRDAQKMPGFDIYAAYGEMQDGLIAALRVAENRISDARTRKSGLDVSATLQNTNTAQGEPVTIRIALAALNGPVEIASIVMINEGSADTVLSDPISLAPGGAPKEIWYRCPLPTTAREATIQPLRFTAQVQLAGGMRLQYHFNRGVFISKPVSVSVSFPQGRTLDGVSVPLQIHVVKNVASPLVLETEFYSPAGLRLKEGRSQKQLIAADARTASVVLNVLVPAPCRPGSFPFTLKVFGNGEDEGTVTSAFFKHYQWIFAGPFPKKRGGLHADYPPEKGVDLRATFPGAQIPISWIALPQHAYADEGRIQLGALLPESSVGYMYTVIKTEWETETVVAFASSSPAIVYVNGEVAAEVDEPSQELVRSRVTLKRGMNSILIKLLSAKTAELFFHLGDEEQLTMDDFNNNLWELIDGYQEFVERSRNMLAGGVVPRVVTLTYKDTDANSVAVIGSFNGWSPIDSSLRRVRPGEWEISLHLPPGRYAYRFLVNNNTHIIDPNCPIQEPDGYGGKNSVLFVK